LAAAAAVGHADRAMTRLRIFAVPPRRQISVVIRLQWQLQFVDLSKNSVVPSSNEFDSQVIALSYYFFLIDAR